MRFLSHYLEAHRDSPVREAGAGEGCFSPQEKEHFGLPSLHDPILRSNLYRYTSHCFCFSAEPDSYNTRPIGLHSVSAAFMRQEHS